MDGTGRATEGTVRRALSSTACVALVLSIGCERYDYELASIDADGGAGGAGGTGGAAVRDASTGEGAGGSGGVDVLAADAGVAAFVPPSCAAWGPFGPPEVVTGLGADAYWGPAPAPDGSVLLVTRTVAGTAEILRGTRSGRGSAFSRVSRLVGVNDQPGPEGTPFLSADQLTLYFYSLRPGGIGSRDLYAARRASLGDDFPGGEILDNVNGSSIDHLPTLTADERLLAFATQRDGNDRDIWSAERDTREQAFGPPRALAEVNTPSIEEAPTLSFDGLELVLASDRAGGRGGLDLWHSERARRDDAFSPPVNLSALNGADDEQDVALTADGRELFFVVSGDGLAVTLRRSLRVCLD